MFGQTFNFNDLAIIGLLVVLEGVLSIDNALVLGLLAKRLPKHQQKRALTYGLVGAFGFRLFAIGAASLLMQWRVVKLLGGLYLLYVALKHFLLESRFHDERKITVGPDGQPILVEQADGEPVPEGEAAERIAVDVPVAPRHSKAAGFWPTVAVIELTDIAFAVDSILAAVALVTGAEAASNRSRFHPKLWVVVVGGMLGVILMRFAAVVFIKLLEKFPRFEISAYLLVLVIGGKLVLDWAFNIDHHHPRLNFHSPSDPAFWIFWLLMLSCFAFGFVPKRKPGAR